ncbi:SUN domain-containing protein 2 [Tachyglossus aculeatus]|uniref:SUN domain-containing protein 2 n=1 Tax=Tachyglossus aculeatus TaxID=9261 RepID=UPI0018F730A1|nr:SUN domain-containing protein 2 [Tachyglossus aculeatus]XP_038612649.1 SUN domain-containing protein 2 [Tachyglossus aculeatus]XP_038612650.1 SUN domain-containing protein 2 [Tachyglossus aculeatus]
MSRRSQRLKLYSQGDDDGGSSSSGGSSLVGSQHSLFKDSPIRTLKRKSSNVKRLSPAPHLGTSSNAHTTYYSESVVSESYVGGPRSSPLARSSILRDPQPDSDLMWNEDLLVRRRDTGSTESSNINRLTENKVPYDTYGSSSGYSSEDDYAGHLGVDQYGSESRLKKAASRAGSFLWMVVTFPGQFFGLCYWWIGTTWYRLTTNATLLDVFVLTRRFPSLKKLLLLLLMLLLLVFLAYGAWYLYPYGLQTLRPVVLSWWAGRASVDSSKRDMMWESGHSAAHIQDKQLFLSHVHTLERRLEALAAEFSSHWQKDALRLERLELWQGEATAAGAGGAGGGGGLSHEDTLTLLEGLVSRREAVLREDFRLGLASRIQDELATLRAEQRQDVDEILKKIARASHETEAWVLQLKSEWQSSTQEALRASQLQDLGRLDGQLADLRRELATLTLKQATVAEQVEGLPQRIQDVQNEVESQFPGWISRFLLRDEAVGARLLQREELQDQLQKLEHKILAHLAQEQGKEAAAGLGVVLRKEGVTGVTEEQVHHIVSQALKRYSEDQIGLVDYALESGGASVINTRCSETYETKTALLSLFGIPLWYHSQSPRTILHPDVYPGNCWAFRGEQGFAVVRLSARIRPTAVTLEHVSKSLLPSSTLLSAPKDFVIFGLDEETQQEGTPLGRFTYDRHGDPIQTFQLEDTQPTTYQVVELRILSNWGHPEYTCIYRFRVHGEPQA